MIRAGDRGGSLENPLWVALFFVFGLTVSGLMVARSQVAGDQLDHLGLGWRLAIEGTWVPFGPPATQGGAQIGGLSGLLIGLPLMLWEDHRAPTVVVLLSHVVAFLLLDSLVRSALGPPERFLFALLYWLGPWRVFFSGFLWNPNYLLLAGATHLWTAWRIRRRPLFWTSFLHVFALGLAMQLHASCLILVLASVALWWRGYIKLDLGGALLAALLVAGSLVPWALAMLAEPNALPASRGLLGYGLLAVHPVLKGLGHWLRFPGPALAEPMACLDFGVLGGWDLDRTRPFLMAFRAIFVPLTILVSGWCNWRLWRHRWRSWRAPIAREATSRAWLGGYIRWSLVASLVTFGLSPTSVSHWYVLSVFHAAVLPLVLTGGALLRSRKERVVRRAAWGYALILLVLDPALAFGAPPYRCGPPRCEGAAYRMPALRFDHPMLERLGIQRTCPVKVNDPQGWWPSTLEPEGKPTAPRSSEDVTRSAR